MLARVPRRLGKMDKREISLFVCDIQERFRDKIHAMPSVIHVARTMVNLAKELKIPIVVTEQYPKGLGHTVPEISECWKDYPNAFDTTSRLLEGDHLPPLKIWPKTQFSMLTDDVRLHLASLNTKAVVLCGIEAHVCVQQSCLDLLESGIDVYLLADGCSSQRQYDRMIAFDFMRSRGAQVTTLESVMFELLQDAKHEKFKYMSSLAVQPRPDPKLDLIPNERWINA